MEGFDDDELAFDCSDEVQEAANARAARIDKARLAASSYSAKIEERDWFMTSTATVHARDELRNEMLLINRLYHLKNWAAVLEHTLPILRAEGKGKGKAKEASTEETELLDLALRSALHAGVVNTQMLDLARRRCMDPKKPGLVVVAAQLIASAPSALLTTPHEAIEALLTAISLGRTPSTFPLLLAKHLQPLSPKLSTLLGPEPPATPSDSDVADEVRKTGLSEAGQKTLGKLLRVTGAGALEEEGDTPRNVRSL